MSSFSNFRCHIICTTILLFVVFSSGGCISWFSLADTAPLTERKEGTGLIIGCIIIIDMVFTRGGEQYPQTTYVDLVYQPTGEKQNKLEIIRVKVDSVGYFMLANIPKGRYGIVAIELEGRNITSYYPTHWNQEWSRDQSSEPSVYGRPEDIHSSVEFDTNGIGNFKYIILAPLPGGSPFLDYRGSYYESLEGIRAYSGLNNYKYYRHPVPQYFLDKYPDSEWAPYLRQLLRK